MVGDWDREAVTGQSGCFDFVAGNVADSLSQIFLLTPRAEVRQRAYAIMGATSAREFAAHVEYRINAYLQLGSESNDQR
uniref:Uncharacterized protein n=1 Tax=Parascaris equorum TaxID=6256 RepID=A0A914RBU5_PAREQ